MIKASYINAAVDSTVSRKQLTGRWPYAPDLDGIMFSKIGRGLFVVPIQAKVKTKHESDNDDDGETDEETPPLELSGVPCTLDAFVQLHISSLGIVLDVRGVLFSRCDGSVLQDNRCRQVFHELVEFDNSPFNLLNIVVSSTDGTKNSICGRGAVGFELEPRQLRFTMTMSILEENSRRFGTRLHCPNQLAQLPGLQPR